MPGTTSLLVPGIYDRANDSVMTYRKLEAVSVVDTEVRACFLSCGIEGRKGVTTVPEQCSIRASRIALIMHKAKRTPRQISRQKNSPFTRWNALKCLSMVVGQPMRTYCCTFDIVESRRVGLAISLAGMGVDSTAFNHCITSPGVGISRSRGGGSYGNRLTASVF